MSQENNWANPSGASAQDVAEMAASLEERGQSLDQQQVNMMLMERNSPVLVNTYLRLDVGLASFAVGWLPQVVPGGKITGLDISTEFVKIAKALSSIQNCPALFNGVLVRPKPFPFQMPILMGFWQPVYYCIFQIHNLF